ncbi:MAG: DUF2802 domain-containing protein [Hydrogenophilaceae bacterium]
MEFIITWRELLIAVVLATVIYLLESVVLSKRRGSKVATDNSEIDKLCAELAALQRRLDELESRLGVAESPESESVHAAYDYAIQYARQGMIAPDIAARCGISRDEAALIVAMHRKGKES